MSCVTGPQPIYIFAHGPAANSGTNKKNLGQYWNMGSTPFITTYKVVYTNVDLCGRTNDS